MQYDVYINTYIILERRVSEIRFLYFIFIKAVFLIFIAYNKFHIIKRLI